MLLEDYTLVIGKLFDDC